MIRPPNGPEGANVQWEIELLGSKMPKDWTSLNFQRILDEADKIKCTKSLHQNVAACYQKMWEY
ncbi:putative peptidylprolyl isomerase [Dioscorea sansibarensis]